MKGSKPLILLVEDEESLRLALTDNLEDEGYEVAAVSTGAEALAALERKSYGLVILDIMLPDMDGYSICRKLRADGVDSMVMMLTARTMEDDIVRGFEAGADDYLAKPYRLRELLSRTSALLRRKEGPTSEVIAFAGYTIDPALRTVSNPDGKPVELTKTEYDLLLCLLKFQDQALARDRILDEVWGKDVMVDGRTVDNFISSLKRKMGWRPSSKFRIHTIRGVGYRIEKLD